MRSGFCLTACFIAATSLANPNSALAQLSGKDIEALRKRGELEGWTFTVGQNGATSYPLHVLCGSRVPTDWNSRWADAGLAPERDLPSSFDWRNYEGQNRCTPVRQQGNCGSCWAFAAIGALESAILIEQGPDPNLDLSEEWLVSCTVAGNCMQGGFYGDAFDHLRCLWPGADPCADSGAVLEADFPYVSGGLDPNDPNDDTPCLCPYPHQNQYRINRINLVGGLNPSVSQIKQAILDYGPVPVCVYASPTFHAYTGGVFNQCVDHEPNHNVVLVGWDDNQGTDGVWILRNSWGPNWGENGYMRIEYGCSRVGELAMVVDLMGEDCNGNGVQDRCDIGDGTSNDVNGNYVPDECDPNDPNDPEFSGYHPPHTVGRYGIEYDPNHPPEGDWAPYPPHGIRLSPGILEGGWAYYSLTLLHYVDPNTPVDPDSFENFVREGSLTLGFKFGDVAGYPWIDGPDFHVWDFESSAWHQLCLGCGNQDELIWKYYTPTDSNRYVSDQGEVRLRVYAINWADTIVDEVSATYEAADETICYHTAYYDFDDLCGGTALDTVYLWAFNNVGAPGDGSTVPVSLRGQLKDPSGTVVDSNQTSEYVITDCTSPVYYITLSACGQGGPGLVAYTIELELLDDAGNVEEAAEGIVVQLDPQGSDPETITTPNTPTGPTSLQVNQSGTYTTSGSSSNQGHPVEYRFDWSNGQYSTWGSATRPYTWPNAGTYCVRAQARCVIHPSVMSAWSACLTVTVTDNGGTTKLVQPDGTGDYPTIQAAINAAADGWTILLADGTFTGSGNRDIDFLGKAITVCSQSGNAAACIIDCQGSQSDQHRGFYFHSGEGEQSMLGGITIKNGYRAADTWPGCCGGGILCAGASPTIAACVLRENTASSGGGLHCNSSNVVVTDCEFWDNTAMGAGFGGALCAEGGSPQLTYCIFSGNSAICGGALRTSDPYLTVAHCTFIENSAPEASVAWFEGWAAPTLTDCEFTGNAGWVVLMCRCYYAVVLTDCAFAHNPGDAWAIYGSASLTACTLADNAGGISVNGTCTIENTIIAASRSGAAVQCASGSSATLTCSDVYGNAGGDWVGCIAGQNGVNGNISADPLFCDPDAGDYHIFNTSPCAPGQQPTCGLIGALDVGCIAPGAPVLTNYDGWPDGVHPDQGGSNTTFTFRVHYYDPEGTPPSIAQVVVEGVPHAMTGAGSDTDYAFPCLGSELGTGLLSYHFYFEDAAHQSARLPAGEWIVAVGVPRPLAWWRFDECTGTRALDAMGTGYDGTIVGATWVEGVYGCALDFDGDNDYVQFTSPVLNTAPYSVCAWVKSEEMTGGPDYVIANGGETSASYGFHMHVNNGHWQYGIRNQSGTRMCSAATGIFATPEWTFLCGTWDGSGVAGMVKLYVNGELQAVCTANADTVGPARNLIIGGSTVSIDTYLWKGALDDVRIYNQVLSPEQIIALYLEPMEPPVLSNYDGWPDGVDPDYGSYDTPFVFRIHYDDPQGTSPAVAQVVIDGQPYTMTGGGSGTDYAFACTGSDLGVGSHNYYFYFENEYHLPARLPASGTWGMYVCNPPTPTWTLRSTTGPTPRYGHAMVETDTGVMLFGGIDSQSNDDETWRWVPPVWTQENVNGPTGRAQHAMAYDSARGVVVLFGGTNGARETWEYTSGWVLRSTSGPSGRTRHAMAYDAARGVVVLFGGYDGTDNGETWAWDGSSWTLLSTTGPSPRRGSAMAYDSSRGVVVLFGGVTGSSQVWGDTWEWNGSIWTQASSSGPAPRESAALTYACGRVVLFGGQGAGYYGDTWEWSGSTWTEVDAPGPAARYQHAMAYDSARRVAVLFGGWSSGYFGDTWEYTCVVPAGDLNCDGVVDFGDINPFVLYLSNFLTWQQTYVDCPAENGDINGDGLYPDFGDINPFVALLTGAK
jgi:hypothetical protein